jgi:spore coat protein U-like protein
MQFQFLAAAAIAAFFAAGAASAAEVSDSFQVTLTIADACEITANNNMDFGTKSFLNTAHDASVDFTIQCTSGTPASISLNGGSGTTGSHTYRTMETGSESIEYGLYTSDEYTTFWGNGSSQNTTVSYTGTGSPDDLTIYGRTREQGEPSAGTYTDIITITATY